MRIWRSWTRIPQILDDFLGNVYRFPTTIRVGELDCHSKRVEFYYLVVKVGKKWRFYFSEMGLFLTNLYVSVGLVRQGRKLIIIPKINDGGSFYVIFTALLYIFIYYILSAWNIFKMESGLVALVNIIFFCSFVFYDFLPRFILSVPNV